MVRFNELILVKIIVMESVKSYRLFLDDIRMPEDCLTYMQRRNFSLEIYKETWLIARNYEEFVSCIDENGLPEMISFDHDLGEKESEEYGKTGLDCAKWLVDYCLDKKMKLPKYIVHSMNPVGVENIEGLLKSFRTFSL